MAREISLLYPPSLVQTFFDKNLFLPPTFSFANLSIESTVSITVTQRNTNVPRCLSTRNTCTCASERERDRIDRIFEEIGKWKGFVHKIKFFFFFFYLITHSSQFLASMNYSLIVNHEISSAHKTDVSGSRARFCEMHYTPTYDVPR